MGSALTALACLASGLAGVLAARLVHRARLRLMEQGLQQDLAHDVAQAQQAARDLHDALLQETQGLVISLQVIAAEFPMDDPARHRIEAVLDQADHVIAEARARAAALRVAPPDDADLYELLVAAGYELSAAGGATFSAALAGPRMALRADVADEVFLLGREALINAFRHGHAGAVRLSLDFEPSRLRLQVHDDGIGLSDGDEPAGEGPGHLGLAGMRERARRVDGSLTIVGTPRRGTRVTLVVPATRAFRFTRARWRWWGLLHRND